MISANMTHTMTLVTDVMAETEQTTTSTYNVTHDVLLTQNGTNSLLDSVSGPHTIYVPVVWSLLVAVGSIGNIIVIKTMCFHGDKSATSYYIINLAVADLAFILIVVPFTTTMFVIPNWLFGNGMCKFIVYMIYVTLQATCLTLTAMTIDRYFAIVHPIKSINSRTPQMSIMINLSIWLASLCLSIPFLLFNKEVHTKNDKHVYCRHAWPSQMWRKGATVAVAMTTYVIPLTIIIVCYTQILKHLSKRRIQIREENEQHSTSGIQNFQRERYRKKVTKMVAIVVLLFAFLWFPIHVFNLWVTFDPDFPRTWQMYNIKIVAHTLSYSNSCVNPFVYAFIGDGFRRAFRKSLETCARRNRVRPVLQSETWNTAANESRARARRQAFSSTSGV